MSISTLPIIKFVAFYGVACFGFWSEDTFLFRWPLHLCPTKNLLEAIVSRMAGNHEKQVWGSGSGDKQESTD